MNRIDINEFFRACRQKGEITYMGKEACCIFDENEGDYGIQQMEDDCYESIYEDQVKIIFQVSSREFIIEDDHGVKTTVTCDSDLIFPSMN